MNTSKKLRKRDNGERVTWGEKSPLFFFWKSLMVLGIGIMVIELLFNILDLFGFIEQHGAWELWYKILSGGR